MGDLVLLLYLFLFFLGEGEFWVNDIIKFVVEVLKEYGLELFDLYVKEGFVLINGI